MNKEITNFIINTLREYNPEMIGIFGSYARDENTNLSDIDILVRFKSTQSLLQLVQIENQISQQLGIKVDLVTEGVIKNKILKESIHKDLQIIYQWLGMIGLPWAYSWIHQQNWRFWSAMAGMIDKLIHDYIDADIDVLWKTIEIDLPLMKEMISKI